VVKESTIAIIKKYLSALASYGIHPDLAILFGSFSKGEEKEFSDIDIIVVAPEFDSHRDLSFVKKLWTARSQADLRIEPIACGRTEWQNGSYRPIIEIARDEGLEILAG
jgi:predicted nucleotidyltransferase